MKVEGFTWNKYLTLNEYPQLNSTIKNFINPFTFLNIVADVHFLESCNLSSAPTSAFTKSWNKGWDTWDIQRSSSIGIPTWKWIWFSCILIYSMFLSMTWEVIINKFRIVGHHINVKTICLVIWMIRGLFRFIWNNWMPVMELILWMDIHSFNIGGFWRLLLCVRSSLKFWIFWWISSCNS